MGNSPSILAYPDIQEILDKALAAEKGLSLTFATRGKAVRFVHRANYFRTLDRAENKKIYAENNAHTLHGRSMYDCLMIRMPKEVGANWTVNVEKVTSIDVGITEL